MNYFSKDELMRKNKDKREKLKEKNMIREKMNIPEDTKKTPDLPKPKNRTGVPKVSDNFKNKPSLIKRIK